MSKTDIALLEEQMSKEVAELRKSIEIGGAPRLSINKDGEFEAPDGAVLGDEIRVVVVEFATHNRYYPFPYDPNVIAPPSCFAVGKDISQLAPSSNAEDPQADSCAQCPHNQFGSRGNGKACKNTRQLALILEDEFTVDEPKLLMFSVPPTGLKSFDSFVASCIRFFNGPPVKAMVTMQVVRQASYNTVAFKDFEANPEFAYHSQFRDDALRMVLKEPEVTAVEPPRTAPTRGMKKAVRTATTRR